MASLNGSPGQGSDSPGQGSDSVHDFSCTKCNQGNRASHYCPVCDVYYCVACLQFLCAHGGILGRNEVGRWGDAAASTTQTSAPKPAPPASDVDCLRHPGRPVETYCSVHDVVVCRLCSAHGHRRCDTKPITDLELPSGSNTDNSAIKQELDTARKTIQTVRQNRESRRSYLEKTGRDARTTVKEYRKELDEVVDKLEQTSLRQIDETINQRETILQADIDVCEDMANGMDALRLDDDQSSGDKVQCFILAKKSKQWVAEHEDLMESLKNDTLDEIIYISLNQDIKEVLTSHDGLGKLTHFFSDRSLKVKGKAFVQVRGKLGQSNCEIENIIQIDCGRCVIVDYFNKTVKLLNDTYSVISEYALPGIPLDVCRVSASEVVVSLNNKTIQFLTVGNELTPAHIIKLDHACRGVAHSNGKLYVTDKSNSLHVYSLSGSKLQTFTKDKNGADIFGASYRIAFSHDGNKIYVTDQKHGLVTVDKHGNKLATLKTDKLKTADGLCVLEDGTVLVSGYDTFNVIQVTPEGGKMIGEVMAQSEGIQPHGICVSRNNAKLLVTNCGKDELCVFDLTTRK